MANTLNLGDGNWATKKDSLLGYNSENNNYKPLPFDFSRGSNPTGSKATTINKDGLIETVGNNVPRIDYKDDSKGALLLEPNRTNLVTYSKDFSSSWISSGTNPPVLTTLQFISPDGTQNASRFQIPITNTTSILQQLFSHTNGQEYTVSAYVKSNSSSNQEFKLFGDYGAPTGISGVLTATSEWQRFTFTYTATGTGNRSGGFYYVPNTKSDIQIYGFQAEQGSYATSYIPTQGGVVTRLADSCSQTPPDGVIGQTQGSIYFQIKPNTTLPSYTQRIVTLYENSSNLINFQLGASNDLTFVSVKSGESPVVITKSVPALDLNDFNKIAVSIEADNFVFYINGVKVGQDVTSGKSMPIVSNIIFANYNSSNPFLGNIKELKLYNTALTDQELQALTTI